jgi:predicted DNA-binding transcriptional regulator AlpA
MQMHGDRRGRAISFTREEANAMDKQVLTTPQMVEKYPFGRTTLLLMAYRGEIPSIKIGGKRLWPAKQVQEWFDSLLVANGDESTRPQSNRP